MSILAQSKSVHNDHEVIFRQSHVLSWEEIIMEQKENNIRGIMGKTHRGKDETRYHFKRCKSAIRDIVVAAKMHRKRTGEKPLYLNIGYPIKYD